MISVIIYKFKLGATELQSTLVAIIVAVTVIDFHLQCHGVALTVVSFFLHHSLYLEEKMLFHRVIMLFIDNFLSFVWRNCF